MVLNSCGRRRGSWIEWRDDLSFAETLFDVKLTFVSSTRPPAP
jgi:hypothetical protein